MRVSGEKKLKKSGNLFPKKPWRRAAAGAGLFFMLLAALFFAGLKGTSLQAQVAPNLRDFTAENYVQHVLVLRNGSVRLHLYTDLRTQREVQNITLMLPYQEGQSLSLESFKIAEVDETGKSFNAVGDRVGRDLAANSSIGSYKVSDDGRQLKLDMNAAVPKDSLRRLEVSYTLYQGAHRYPDVGEINMGFLAGEQGVEVKQSAVFFSFEASPLPEEKEAFRLFQRDSLKQAGDLYEEMKPYSAARLIGHPAVGIVRDWQPLFAAYAEDIPADTEISFRLMLPSGWLARMPFESSGGEPAYERIMREEENFRQQELRRYEYRLWAEPATYILMGLSVVLFLIFHWYSLSELYRVSWHKSDRPPDEAPPGVMAYMKEGKIKGNLILSVLYVLASKGFIELGREKIYRVDERVLPDEALLYPHERVVLHWFWDLCLGEDALAFDALESRVSQRAERSAAMFFRLRNLLDCHCAEHGYIPGPGEKKPKLNHIITSLLYLFFAFLLSWLGSFYLPLLLLPLAVVFLITAFTSSKYTRKGYVFLVKLRAYERYLSEIDHTDMEEEEVLEALDRCFPDAVALGNQRSFLLNLRYLLPVSVLLESSFLRRFGFSRLQNVMTEYIKRRGGLSAGGIHSLYSYIAKQTDKKSTAIQTTLVRLNLRLFSREKAPEDAGGEAGEDSKYQEKKTEA